MGARTAIAIPDAGRARSEATAAIRPAPEGEFAAIIACPPVLARSHRSNHHASHHTAFRPMADLMEKLFIGLACVIAIICLIAAVVFIQSTFKWGLWPSLAEAHDEFLGLPDSAETEQRLAAMDDCLVNAVAKQPFGRLRKLLLDDLTAACGYRITAAYLGLHAKDKYLAVAMDEITTGEAMNDFVLRYGAPIIARAQPR